MGLIWGHFLCCLFGSLSIGNFEIYKFDLPCHLTAVQTVWTAVLLKYILCYPCYLYRFYFHWGNRTLSVWDLKLHSGHGQFQFPARVMFYHNCSVILFLNHNIFSSLSGSSNCLKNKSWFMNWKCDVFMFMLAAFNFGQSKLSLPLIALWFLVLAQQIFSSFYFCSN